MRQIAHVVALLAAPIMAPAAADGVGATRAFEITADNVDALPRGGPSAIAGLGDWWLTNGKLCVAVSGLGHDAGVVAGGGSLVDIALCELDNDQWLNNSILAGLSKDDALPAEDIRAEVDGDDAAIIVSARNDGIAQQVRYSLRPGERVLRMSVRLERVGPGRRIGSAAIVTLHPKGALVPFSLSADGRTASPGSELKRVDHGSYLSLLGAMTAADTSVFTGNAIASAPISYRMQLRSATRHHADGQRSRLPIFQIAFDDSSVQGWLSRPPWIGGDRPGALLFAQSLLMDIAEGEAVVAEFEIEPRASRSVSVFTDPMYPEVRLEGRTSPGSSVEIFDQAAGAIGQTYTDEEGNFAFGLPRSARYRVRISSPHGQVFEGAIAGGADALRFDHAFAAPATVALPQGELMRLTFLGVDGTPDPQFRAGLRQLRLDGEAVPDSLRSNALVLTGRGGDARQIALPPGRYRVFASRGLLFDVAEARLEIGPGEQAELDIGAPNRLLHENGTLAADFHVHSGVSFDSTVPREDQVARFAAEGAQILITSEHNRIAPIAQFPGLPVQLVNGVEYTGMAHTAPAPTTIGHSNGFPVRHDPQAFRGGMPRVEGMRLRELIGAHRRSFPGALFQLNHPRGSADRDSDSTFFDHLSSGVPFDPRRPLASGPNARLLDPGADGLRDLDFELIEVMNGNSVPRYEAVREDWFALLRAGHRKVASANSDSHAWSDVLGVPQNRIRLGDTALPVAEAELLAAIRGGRLYGTSGPLLDLALEAGGRRHGLGGTCRCAGADLKLRVDAVPWVDVDRLSVFVNGQIAHQQAIDGPGNWTVPLRFEADGFVVVEVRGRPGPVYSALYPGNTPIAFSNPIFVQLPAGAASGAGEILDHELILADQEQHAPIE